MAKSLAKTREEARRLYLTLEMSTNAEIAARLKVKPHTIAKWRREEGWDDLRVKIDRRAGEMLVEKLATDRVSLNVKHFRYWDAVLAKLGESLKDRAKLDTRELDRVTSILHRAQQGQRLAKGLSLSGEAEEQIRAQAEAENRAMIDAFIDSVKENVDDESVRERIRLSILAALPEAANEGAIDSDDALAY